MAAVGGSHGTSVEARASHCVQQCESRMTLTRTCGGFITNSASVRRAPDVTAMVLKTARTESHSLIQLR